MNIEELAVGDVVEALLDNTGVLVEIIGLKPGENFPIKALVPKSMAQRGYGTILSNLEHMGKIKEFSEFIDKIDQTKLMQHGVFPFREDEILRKTDQRW